MGIKFPPKDEELYRRIDEVLHYIWDPIGVSGMPMARDEYHSYLPKVFALVRENAGADQVANYLVQVVTERMELPETMEHALEIAAILQDWKESLDEKYGGEEFENKQ